MVSPSSGVPHTCANEYSVKYLRRTIWSSVFIWCFCFRALAAFHLPSLCGSSPQDSESSRFYLYPLLVPQPRCSLKGIGWIHFREYLICFLSLRNIWHSWQVSSVLKNHCFIYFVHFLKLLFWVGWYIEFLYSILDISRVIIKATLSLIDYVLPGKNILIYYKVEKYRNI